MMQQFPIFVDLHVVPPLIIGDAPALAAKLRLLRKAAQLVDVIASKNAEWRSEFATDTGVCWLAEMDRQAAKAAIKGRPLVILDCEDESLNRFLVATARAYGVPVNVPDNRALSGFYLGTIVDRAPLIIGISTSGLAPVLGQALRARLESMLPRNYGRLAHFLADLRCRLSALTPARRRRFQHDMINGPAARHVLAGHPQLAEACADAALPMPRSNRPTTRIGNRRIRRSAIISSICRTARGRGATNQPRGRQFCRHRNGPFFYKFFHEFFGASLDKLSAKSQLACMASWHSQAMSARRC